MSDMRPTETKQELQRDFQRVKQDTSELAGLARERGMEELEGARGQIADRAERIADAVERTASEIEEEGGVPVGSYGRSLASMMRQMAGGIREHDVQEFAREITSFARRNPAVFLAGSVALGFGIARFLKASSERQAGDYSRRRFDDDADWSRDHVRSYGSGNYEHYSAGGYGGRRGDYDTAYRRFDPSERDDDFTSTRPQMSSAGGNAPSEWSDRWSDRGSQRGAEGPTGLTDERDVYEQSSSVQPSLGRPAGAGGSAGGLGDAAGASSSTRLGGEQQDAQTRRGAGNTASNPAASPAARGASTPGTPSEALGNRGTGSEFGSSASQQDRSPARKSRPDGGVASEAPGRPSGSPSPSPYTDPSSTTKPGSSSAGSSAFTGGTGSGPMKGGKQ